MYKKTYDHLYLEKLESIFEKTKIKSYELLSPLPNEVILDVGCGVGNDAIIFADSGAKVFGIDHDSHLIEIAENKNSNVTFINCEAEKIPLDDNFVDKLRFDRTLQHIENQPDVIKETSRLLKKNGECHIVDIDYFSLSLFMSNHTLERKIVDALAYNRFRGGWQIRNLPNLLQKNGFQITHFEIQNYIFENKETIGYLYRFDKIICEEFEQNNITKDELDFWEDFKNSPMNLSLNILFIIARKN